MDWVASFLSHWKPALIGVVLGIGTGLIARRLLKSLVLIGLVALVVLGLVAFTTDWLKAVDLASVGRRAGAVARSRGPQAFSHLRSWISTHGPGSLGFASGFLASLVFASGRRRK